MVYDKIHLIWTGPDPENKLQQAVEHWKKFGGNREIICHTDEKDLLPEFKEVREKHIHNPIKLSDLLRWSILLTQGGWYFDVDIRTRQPLDVVEAECKINKEQCFVTFLTSYPQHPQCDVLACDNNWKYKQQIIDYIKNIPDDIAWHITSFAGEMLFSIMLKDPKAFCYGPELRYSYTQADWTQRVFNRNYDYGPKLYRIEVKRIDQEYVIAELEKPQHSTLLEAMDRLKISAQTAWKYANAIKTWGEQGFPTRTKEEVKDIFRNQCLPCEHRKNGKCVKCGCRINESTIALVNKIKMSTEHCNLIPPKW